MAFRIALKLLQSSKQFRAFMVHQPPSVGLHAIVQTPPTGAWLSIHSQHELLASIRMREQMQSGPSNDFWHAVAGSANLCKLTELSGMRAPANRHIARLAFAKLPKLQKLSLTTYATGIASQVTALGQLRQLKLGPCSSSSMIGGSASCDLAYAPLLKAAKTMSQLTCLQLSPAENGFTCSSRLVTLLPAQLVRLEMPLLPRQVSSSRSSSGAAASVAAVAALALNLCKLTTLKHLVLYGWELQVRGCIVDSLSQFPLLR